MKRKKVYICSNFWGTVKKKSLFWHTKTFLFVFFFSLTVFESVLWHMIYLFIFTKVDMRGNHFVWGFIQNSMPPSSASSSSSHPGIAQLISPTLQIFFLVQLTFIFHELKGTKSVFPLAIHMDHGVVVFSRRIQPLKKKNNTKIWKGIIFIIIILNAI